MIKDENDLIDQFEHQLHLAPVCGGTVASSQLRSALRFRAECSPHLITRVDAVIEKWRASLREHNAQPIKLVEYDDQNGEVRR